MNTTYQLIIPDVYRKRAGKFLKSHPELLKLYEKTLRLLELNPYHPSLRLHKLEGKLQGLYSVSINLSYRITIEFLIKDKQIILINVGSHDQVY
jgi:mRNA-degrading endonuclease YafQ of YafQ-DinJ toxin-antitoxin module